MFITETWSARIANHCPRNHYLLIDDCLQNRELKSERGLSSHKKNSNIIHGWDELLSFEDILCMTRESDIRFT